MNQQCKVCGEPAAGFHFGAFTCEGCKSFFGRTYNNLSSISACKNNDTCIINKKNRTACKACRLNKCISVGMSKSGSRYGRRSNWFKIHCLLNEQREQQEKGQHQHQHQPPHDHQQQQLNHHHQNQFEQLINQSHQFPQSQSVVSNHKQEQQDQQQSISHHHHHDDHHQYKSLNNKSNNKTATSPTSLLSNTYNNMPSHLLTNICKNVANKRKTPSDSGASSADLEEGNSGSNHGDSGSIDGNNSIESAPPYIPKQKTAKIIPLTAKIASSSSSSLSPLSNIASSTTNGHHHHHHRHNHVSAFSPVQRSNFKSLPDICYNSEQLLKNHNENKTNKRSHHHNHRHPHPHPHPHQYQSQHQRHDSTSTSSIDEHQNHNEPIDLSIKSKKSKQTRSRSSSTSSTSELSAPMDILNATENNVKIPTRTSFTHFMDLPKPTPLDLTYFPNTSWMSSLLCHQNNIGKNLRISTTSEQLL